MGRRLQGFWRGPLQWKELTFALCCGCALELGKDAGWDVWGG
jgi:hypothetical protein